MKCKGKKPVMQLSIKQSNRNRKTPSQSPSAPHTSRELKKEIVLKTVQEQNASKYMWEAQK